MNKSLEKLKKIQELCIDNNIMISTAESCTGGYMSKLITDLSGSSKFYNGSIIAYSNKTKTDVLNVPSEVIEKYGAVSREVAALMSDGAYKAIDCNISISITGIMELDNQKNSKDTQVFISIKSEKSHIIRHFSLNGSRKDNRENTVNHALDCLYDFIHKNYLVS